MRLRPVDTTGGPGYLIESRSRDYPDFGPYAIVLLGIDEADAAGERIASMTVYAEPATVARFAASSPLAKHGPHFPARGQPA